MKEKVLFECFGLFESMLYINMKKQKNIACSDFVNVNKALTLNFHEENQSFILDL